jgi:hypothetical protein
VANTKDKEVIVSKIKIQQQKENKLNFEKKSLKDYSFQDKFYKLTRYAKSIKISHSKKYLFIGFGSRDRKMIESRRNSMWQMEDMETRENLSGLIRILSFPDLSVPVQINPHQFGVSKILINKGKIRSFVNWKMTRFCSRLERIT